MGERRRCWHCARVLSAREVTVWVRFQRHDGQALLEDRVPMHLLCSLSVSTTLVGRGWSAATG